MDAFFAILIIVLLFGPLIYAVLVLKTLDRAAKQRKRAGHRILIVDFFSLILLAQFAFQIFASIDTDSRIGTGRYMILGLMLLAVGLIWLTTIKTISRAGIQSSFWRSLISMVVIPTMYIGCFYLSFGIGQSQSSYANDSNWFFLGLSIVGMIVSPLIVRAALKATENENPDQTTDDAVDPFAD